MLSSILFGSKTITLKFKAGMHLPPNAQSGSTVDTFVSTCSAQEPEINEEKLPAFNPKIFEIQDGISELNSKIGTMLNDLLRRQSDVSKRKAIVHDLLRKVNKPRHRLNSTTVDFIEDYKILDENKQFLPGVAQVLHIYLNVDTFIPDKAKPLSTSQLRLGKVPTKIFQAIHENLVTVGDEYYDALEALYRASKQNYSRARREVRAKITEPDIIDYLSKYRLVDSEGYLRPYVATVVLSSLKIDAVPAEDLVIDSDEYFSILEFRSPYSEGCKPENRYSSEAIDLIELKRQQAIKRREDMARGRRLEPFVPQFDKHSLN